MSKQDEWAKCPPAVENADFLKTQINEDEHGF